MKVLAVISDGTWGGAQRHVRDLIAHTMGVRFILATGSEGRLTAEARSHGVSVRLIPGLGRAASPALLPRSRAALRSVVANEGPTVVHAHGVKAAAVSAGAADAFVYTSHGSAVADPTRPFAQRAVLRQLERRLAARVRIFIGVSRAECAGATAMGIPADRIVHIPNGVPVGPTPRGRTGPVRNVGFLGRLVPEKGAGALPAIARRLGRDLLLHVAGDGPLAEPLRTLPNVRLHGWIHDVPAFLEEMDVLVMPSQKEGLPYALLEAMERAKAVVSTAVGGVVDVVEHGANGLLTEPGDVEALGAAIDRLVALPEEADRLGSAARQTIMDRYRIEGMVKRTQDVYAACSREVAAWRA